MTISKEERAELRRVVTSHPYIRLFAWVRGVDGEDDAIICDEGGTQICDDMGELHVDLTIAAVNALPKTLDALDAADERIAGLEARLAEESGDFYDCAHCGERKHKSNGGDPGVYCDECSLRMGLEHTIDVQKTRIAELEAAAQWRPIEEAPRDGSRVLVVNGRNSPVFARFIDRQWRSDERLGIVRPSHYLAIPALPEGGV